MIGRVFGVFLAVLLAAILFYVSRYWPFDFWGREGLFGVKALRPNGDLLRSWLGGTMLRPFDIVIWAIGAFLFLSAIEAIADRLKRIWS